MPGGHSPLDPSLECSREASPEFSLETNPWALQPLLLGDSVYPLRKVGGGRSAVLNLPVKHTESRGIKVVFR